MEYLIKLFIFALIVISTTSALSVQRLNDRFPLFQPRVVGGIEAEQHSAPYIVSLAIRMRGSQYRPFCGGALINESWILTAAHCLEMDPFRIHLIAGHHDMTNLNSSTVQFRRSDFYREHSEFNSIGPYDIGLIHISRPFNLTTPFVQTINISQNLDPIGELTLFGWGSTTNTTDRIFPNRLQTTNLTIVNNEYCRENFEPLPVDERNICAGMPNTGLSACVGDSGGPAVQDGELLGVVSWGPITCESEIGPSVFTRVNAYSKWINSTLAGDYDDDYDAEDDDDDEEEEEEVEEEEEEEDEQQNIEATTENEVLVDIATGNDEILEENIDGLTENESILGQAEGQNVAIEEKNNNRVISLVMNYHQQ